MKLLFDENLPPRAARGVASAFPESIHVNTLKFNRTDDRVLFAYAAEHGYVMVTRDKDFKRLSLELGSPPKVVLVAVGNAQIAQVGPLILAFADEINALEDPRSRDVLQLGPSALRRLNPVRSTRTSET